MFPLSNLIVQRNFLRLLTKVIGLVVQKDYTCPGGFSVEKHVCVRKKSFSLSFLNLERNILNFYLEQFSKKLSILFSMCSKERFYKSFSLKKYQVFFLYLAKMRQNFIFERNFYESFATTVVARWKISVTFFSGWRTNSFSSLDFEQKKWLLADVFSAGLSKLQSTCPHELFNELCFMDFLSFLVIDQKCSTMWRVFRKSCWSCIPKTKGNLWGENCIFFEVSFFLPFPGIQRKDLGLLY